MLAELPAALALLLLQEPGGLLPCRDSEKGHGASSHRWKSHLLASLGRQVCCWEISLLLAYRSFNLERPLSVLSIPSSTTLYLLLLLPLAGSGVQAPNISKRWKRVDTLEEGQRDNQPPQEPWKWLKIWGVQICRIFRDNLASPASL